MAPSRVLAIAIAGTTFGCAIVYGYDDYEKSGADASKDGGASGTPSGGVTGKGGFPNSGGVAGVESGGGSPSGGSGSGGAVSGGGGSGGCPTLSCDNHCGGLYIDNCGQSIDCNDPCTGPNSCIGNVCVTVASSGCEGCPFAFSGGELVSLAACGCSPGKVCFNQSYVTANGPDVSCAQGSHVGLSVTMCPSSAYVVCVKD